MEIPMISTIVYFAVCIATILFGLFISRMDHRGALPHCKGKILACRYTYIVCASLFATWTVMFFIA